LAWTFFIIASVALVLLHLWWRKRFSRLEATCRRETEELRAAHQKDASARDAQENALLDSMVEGLLVLDDRGRIRLANRAFASLFDTAGDLRGKTPLEAVRLHEISELASSLREKRQIEGHELKLAGPAERWVGVSGTSLSDGGGSRGTLLVFHDLTRIKKLERTRQEFVANVSHELRTPLSMIKGYVETLLDGAKDDPELATRFLQTIDRNTERLTLLIEDLLTISELESNRVKLNLQPVNARSLTAKVIADMATRAATRNVKLLNEVPEMEVAADAGRFEQVLINLLDNGIKYGRASGTVEVRARPADGHFLEFSVCDDGPGIAPGALERIFERFYRDDKARSRDQGGTGLGLAIVKHLVQSHGGKVWVRSEPGAGASFHFTLPRPGSGAAAD
jgi:two-component system phosphate regulon sensor histidine kinase PhoR